MPTLSHPRPARHLALAAALGWGLVSGGADEPARVPPFDPNVKVTATDAAWVVESDGLPTHKTAAFPNATNPNEIRKQSYRFVIPRRPQKAARPTPTPFGPIGVAINGIPFYNPYNAEGRDAVMGPFAEVFDSCCGHPDPMGRYHYHKFPSCVKSPFREAGDGHSPLIGYMFDGFALYGPKGEGGVPPGDLDECNGHEDAARGYHYHATESFPYLIGAYRGVPAAGNIDRPRFPGRNGPVAFDGPPPHPLMVALDRDRDGTLSRDEIADAPKALKALDRDGDGTLSREELRPPGPPGGGGGRRPGGPGGAPPGAGPPF